MIEAKLFSSSGLSLVRDCDLKKPEKNKMKKQVSSPAGIHEEFFITQVLVSCEMQRPLLFHNITGRNFNEKIKFIAAVL